VVTLLKLNVFETRLAQGCGEFAAMTAACVAGPFGGFFRPEFD